MSAQTAIDAVHNSFGVVASYVPAGGGDAVSVRIVINQADAPVDFGGSRLIATTRRNVDLRASEVATRPAKGAQFVVGVRTFIVTQPAVSNDPDFLVWTCLCDERGA